jgi:hypothetical protein
MRRAAAAAGALALIAVAFSRVAGTGATFTAGPSANSQPATADNAPNWVHLYSQSTDPDGLTGYVAGDSGPAATGQDRTLSVDLGNIGLLQGAHNRAFTAKAVATLPESAAAVTATISVTDNASGYISSAALNVVGSSGGTASRSLAAGGKVQANVTTPALSIGLGSHTYSGSLRITLAPPGDSTGFLRYDIPVSLHFNCVLVCL